MRPTRPQGKHSLSVLLFPPPSVLPLLESCRGFVKTFFLQTVQFSVFTFNKHVTGGIVIAGHFVRCCAVNSFSRSVGHMVKRTASRMSSGCFYPVRSRCLCSEFSQARMACEKSSFLVSCGDKNRLLSHKLRPAANGPYSAAGHRHCSRPDSRSAPRITSRASPSVLEMKKCCNSWPISFVTPNS